MTRRHENFTIKFVIFVTCKLQLSGVIFDSRSSSGGAAAAAHLRACGSGGGVAVGSAVGQRRSSSFQTCLSSSWSKELGTHQAANCCAATATTAARRDGDDAGVAVVADLFSYKAVDKSSMPPAAPRCTVCLPCVLLMLSSHPTNFFLSSLIFTIIGVPPPPIAAPRLVVGGGGGEQSKLRGVDFAPMQ